jgi:hypothetical protein
MKREKKEGLVKNRENPPIKISFSLVGLAQLSSS